jgi:hypothetical protein
VSDIEATGAAAPRSARVARWLLALTAAPFAVAALFVATVLPYRYWDSLAFGSWSRLIAETGDVFSPGLIANNLNRPLFYVEQGLAWRVIGYHEWIGRWLSVLFAIVFALALWLLARTLARGSRAGAETLFPASTLALALASSVFASYVAAGMTDVPVAATASVTALALWASAGEESPSPGRAWGRAALVAVLAACTVLAKPTGLVALLGVVLATAVLLARAIRRGPLLGRLGGLVAGVAGALVYDAIEAHRLHTSLGDFLRAGNTDYFLSRGAHDRLDRILDANWLGEAPRLLLLLGIVYALARAAGARPRPALAVGAPVALAWSIAGPVVADGGTPYPFRGGFSFGLVAWIVLVAAVLGALVAGPRDPLPRWVYAALLLWLAPGAIAWISYRSDEVRFLSPAWPAAMLLAGAALTTVLVGVARLRPAAELLPAAAVALLVVLNLPSIDGLGRSGWNGLLDLGWSRWGSRAAVENYAYGPFSYELDLARANVGPGQRIISADGRLTYFFPGRVEVVYPTTCNSIARFRYFALLTGGESADIAGRLYGAPSNPLSWSQCTAPRLHMVGYQQGIWAAFVNGAPTRPSTPDDCHITRAEGTLLDAVFIHDTTYDVARTVRARAVSVGFKDAHIEQTACDAFRVVVTGIPEPKAAQADFLRETKSTGFDVVIQPPVRYPDVDPDVPPPPSS